MLNVVFDSVDIAMPVPYPASTPTNQGYIECRSLPDIAAAIPEAAGSALRDLLVSMTPLNSPLFTVGCDLGQSTDEPWVAGGYIQVAVNAWRLPVQTMEDGGVQHLFPEDVFVRLQDVMTKLGEMIARLMEAKSENYDWHLRIIHQPIVLINEKASPEWIDICSEYWSDEDADSANSATTGSLTILFEAAGSNEESAIASREIMIRSLQEILAGRDIATNAR